MQSPILAESLVLHSVSKIDFWELELNGFLNESNNMISGFGSLPKFYRIFLHIKYRWADQACLGTITYLTLQVSMEIDLAKFDLKSWLYYIGKKAISKGC